jgi:predicted ester cyclase
VSAESNKNLLRRCVDQVWNNGNPTAVEGFVAPGYRRHTSPTAEPLEILGQIERLKSFRKAFPDVTITVEEIIAEGDLVAFRSTMRGTHSGEFLGIPPTGKAVIVGLVDVIRVADGRFVEQWGGPDLFDLLRQVGASFTLGAH